MKQILPELKQINKHLSFAKCAFTRGGFRHVSEYIDGLIALNKKTVKKISEATVEKTHQSLINRVLTEAKFEQELLETRYIKKVRFLTKGQYIILIFDDSLVERNGKRVEETQSHKDHTQNRFITGHQFFTSMIYTSLVQLPLFPRLYSKNTVSKIEMANQLIDNLFEERIKLNAVLMDSWYSDKKIIKKCITKGIKVICGIKSNRNISFKRDEWLSLSSFSNSLTDSNFGNYYIDDSKYMIAAFRVKLSGIPKIKMLVSKEYFEDRKEWSNNFHLISTSIDDSPVKIIRLYSLRWCIETFHRDIKQNLGFDKAFFQKKEGIVRHAIYVILAYITLKLFMFHRRMKNMSIGECIAYIQNKEMDGFIMEIIEIEDKSERIARFEEVFIRESAKV
jgi:hypothetical protein